MKTWLESANRSEFGPLVAVADGRTLCDVGQPLDNLWLVIHGTLERFHTSPTGDIGIVQFLRAPMLVGDAELLAKFPSYSAGMRAATPCAAYKVTRVQAERIINERPAALRELAQCVAQSGLSAMRTSAVRLGDVEANLAIVLLSYAQLFGVESTDGIRIDRPLKRHHLANAAGITVRSVNRVLKRWSDAGIASRIDRHYVVRSLDGLRALSGEGESSLLVSQTQ